MQDGGLGDARGHLVLCRETGRDEAMAAAVEPRVPYRAQALCRRPRSGPGALRAGAKRPGQGEHGATL